MPKHNMSYSGGFKETIFFLDDYTQKDFPDFPSNFTIDDMPMVPKGTVLYLHSDIVHCTTRRFIVKSSSLSVTALPHEQKEFDHDGGKISLEVAPCRIIQEVLLKSITPEELPE